jgi:hypothetical protein
MRGGTLDPSTRWSQATRQKADSVAIWLSGEFQVGSCVSQVQAVLWGQAETPSGGMANAHCNSNQLYTLPRTAKCSRCTSLAIDAGLLY